MRKADGSQAGRAEGGVKMAVTEKMKALVARILEQCEQQGLTVSEVKRIPQLLESEINDRIIELNRETPFSLR